MSKPKYDIGPIELNRAIEKCKLIAKTMAELEEIFEESPEIKQLLATVLDS